MKKIRIFITLALLIFALLGAMTSHADITATAKLIGPDTVRLGETFTVEFKASCNEAFGMAANLTENGPITRKEIKLSSELTGWSKSINDDNGNILLYDDTFSNAFKGQDKVMFSITYSVNADAKAGDAISVSLNNIEISNLDGQTNPFAVTYTKTVSRKLNTNTNLTAIKVDGTAINGFDYNTVEYQMSVPHTTSSINVTASPAGEGATYTVSGNSDLKFGANTVVIKVTAESGAVKNYTIKVTRQDPPDEAFLSNLKIDGYTLSPEFDPAVLNYAISVGYTKDKITVTPSAAAGITFHVEGADKLAVGDNTVKVIVTDQYEHTNTYTITVTRRQNNNANLLKLSVEGHTLSPEFNYTTTKYSLVVNNSVATLKVSAVAAGDGATATVTGDTLGADGGTVTITVTAMDGTEKIYTIQVTREGGNSGDIPDIPDVPVNPPAADGAKLSSLEVKDATLNPQFSPETVSYSLTVAYNITAINVIAVGENGANVTITGADGLKVGDNLVKILVTAEGKSDTEYVIKVTRAAKPATPDKAKLQGINLSAGILSPAFDASVYSYVVYLPYEYANTKLTIAALCGENASLQGGGANNTLESPKLRAGSNTITLRTVTTDGGNATYTILVYVMPEFNGKAPDVSTGNESTNETSTTLGGTVQIIGSTQVGGKLSVKLPESAKGYTVKWFCDGKAVKTGTEFTVTADYAGKKIEVKLFNKDVEIKGTQSTIDIPATGTLDNQTTGFDIIGMVISLIAALATLVIGFILGKMFAKRH